LESGLLTPVAAQEADGLLHRNHNYGDESDEPEEEEDEDEEDWREVVRRKAQKAEESDSEDEVEALVESFGKAAVDG
jgi:hypothetical protein